MIDVSTAQFIVNTISFLCAYCFVVTVSGAFRAWVAVQMGDTTVEDQGFLTLNPVMHMNPIGMIFLVLRSFGVGTFIPIDPSRIQGRWRMLKILCAYYSDTLFHGICAIIGLLALIIWFGPIMIPIVELIVKNRDASHLYMTYHYPMHSSFSIVIGFIIAAAVSLHIGLMVIELLFNSLILGFYFLVQPTFFEFQDTALYELIAWLIIVIFFYTPLVGLITAIISGAGYTIAQILHVIQ